MKTVVMLVLLALGASSSAADEQLENFIGEGARIPAFDLKTVSGERFSSGDLRGRVGVIAFLRADQGASAQLMAELGRLDRELGNASWEKIAVFAGEVRPETVRKAAQEARFNARLLLDPERQAYGRFGAVAVPSVAVFDADSRVVYSHPGYGVGLYTHLSERVRGLLGLPSRSREDAGARRAAPPAVGLARRLVELGDLKKAEDLLRKSIEKSPSLDALLLLGEVLLQSGRAEEALEWFQKAAGLPDAGVDLRVEVGIARAHAALGRVEDAEKRLHEVLTRSPETWEARVALGDVLLERGRTDEAISEYKKAISILSRSWRAR